MKNVEGLQRSGLSVSEAGVKTRVSFPDPRPGGIQCVALGGGGGGGDMRGCPGSARTHGAAPSGT